MGLSFRYDEAKLGVAPPDTLGDAARWKVSPKTVSGCQKRCKLCRKLRTFCMGAFL